MRGVEEGGPGRRGRGPGRTGRGRERGVQACAWGGSGCLAAALVRSRSSCSLNSKRTHAHTYASTYALTRMQRERSYAGCTHADRANPSSNHTHVDTCALASPRTDARTGMHARTGTHAPTHAHARMHTHARYPTHARTHTYACTPVQTSPPSVTHDPKPSVAISLGMPSVRPFAKPGRVWTATCQSCNGTHGAVTWGSHMGRQERTHWAVICRILG